MKAHRAWPLSALPVVLLVLAACTPAPANTPPPTTTHTPASGDPIVVSSLTRPDTYDPTDTDDPATTRVAALLQRGLFRYDAKGKAVPEVAASVDTTDNRVFHVTLAGGWRFSNGEPVTADSFVDAWSRAAAPATPRLRRELFSPIAGFVASKDLPTAAAAQSGSSDAPLPTGRSPRLEGLTVIDERRFTITLSRPHPGFEQRLGHVAFAPLPDVAFTDPDSYARAPIGNGPYQLQGGWNAEQTLRLRPNAGYTAEGAAKNVGLDFRTYTEPETALQDVEAGRLDVLDVLPTDALGTYKSSFADKAVNQPVGQVLGLTFPVTTGPWSGAAGSARRAAISMAIDRDALTRTVFAGTREAATDLAAPVVEGHSRELCGPHCRLDAREASTSLTQAGGIPSGLTIAYAADTDQAPVVTAICADVTQHLGITCAGHPYPSTTALKNAVRAGKEPNPHLMNTRMDYPLLESFLAPRFTSGVLTNDSGYRDAATDLAFTRAVTVDGTERATRLQAAEQHILADLPVVPLLNGHVTAVSSAAVDNVRFDVFGDPDYAQISRPRRQ